MKLYCQAALTIKQRQKVKKFHEAVPFLLMIAPKNYLPNITIGYAA